MIARTSSLRLISSAHFRPCYVTRAQCEIKSFPCRPDCLCVGGSLHPPDARQSALHTPGAADSALFTRLNAPHRTPPRSRFILETWGDNTRPRITICCLCLLMIRVSANNFFVSGVVRGSFPCNMRGRTVGCLVVVRGVGVHASVPEPSSFA